MSPTTAREHEAGRERRVLRGAVLREAAQLVGARDVLVVDAAPLDRVRLVEALVCGEHWEASTPLELAREPLLLRAVTAGRVLRCCPRRPRRIVGPFWSTAATFVPGPPAAGVVVVFAGGQVQPPDGLAREAAAMATLGGWPAEEPVTAAGDAHAVVVVRAEWLAAEPSGLRRVRAALASAPAGTQALDLDGVELCVIVPSADPLVCERVAELVGRELERERPAAPVAVGWAVGGQGGPPSRAVEVVRAMARHEERRRREADDRPGAIDPIYEGGR